MELSPRLFPIMEDEEEPADGEANDQANEPANEIVLTKPALRAVVLDNDETTGSYGIIYSLLTHLRPLNLTEEDAAIFYNRLAHAMDHYQLFRPHLGHFLQTLDLLGDDTSLDAVIMYTNQTCELTSRRDVREVSDETELASRRDSRKVSDEGQDEGQDEDQDDTFTVRNLLYSVPLTIAYLMNEVYHTIAFHKILTRPPLLRGIQHASCPKSFSRVLDMFPSKARSTEKILFVDDNARPEFITACPKTETYPHSYVRIRPYVRILTDAELDELLGAVLHGMLIPPATLQAIKTQYRTHAPLTRLRENTPADTELESLRQAVLEFFCI
jgi:hypothetical protein